MALALKKKPTKVDITLKQRSDEKLFLGFFYHRYLSELQFIRAHLIMQDEMAIAFCTQQISRQLFLNMQVYVKDCYKIFKVMWGTTLTGWLKVIFLICLFVCLFCSEVSFSAPIDFKRKTGRMN